MILCGDMHQSFTGALAKWFFDNFPMFADSFVLSIHCVARGLGTAFSTSAMLRAVVPCDSTAFLYYFIVSVAVASHFPFHRMLKECTLLFTVLYHIISTMNVNAGLLTLC